MLYSLDKDVTIVYVSFPYFGALNDLKEESLTWILNNMNNRIQLGDTLPVVADSLYKFMYDDTHYNMKGTTFLSEVFAKKIISYRNL